MKIEFIKKQNLNEFLIKNEKLIIDGIKKLNNTKKKVLFIIDKKKRIIGSLSDGDLRFGLQKNLSLTENITKFCNKKIKFFYTKQKKNIRFQKINNKDIKFYPIVDNNKKIVEILYLSQVEETNIIHDTPFVIIAGGFGKRLNPLTNNIPKPLVRINGKPIIEHIIDKAISEGFRRFIISTGYMASKIEKYLKRGTHKKIEITFIKENKPLGTAGFIFLLKKFKFKNFFITNGDVLTRFKYVNLLNFHKKKKSDATIAAINKVLRFPFGEIEFRNENFLNVKEKPLIEKFINCGLYVINKNSLSILKKKNYLDMPDYFNLLKKRKKKIKVYSLYESWTDITDKEDIKYLDKKNSNFYDL